jgi:hypothetical protein
MSRSDTGIISSRVSISVDYGIELGRGSRKRGASEWVWP